MIHFCGCQATLYQSSETGRSYQFLLRNICIPLVDIDHSVDLIFVNTMRSSHNFFEEQISRLTQLWDDKIPGKDLGKRTRRGIEGSIEESSIILEEHTHDLLVNLYVSRNSRESYLKHYRCLFEFLAKIGDYRSMILFHNKKRRNIIESMNAVSVAMFMLFKTQKNGTVLRCPITNVMVCDVFGDPIICRGDWKDPGNAEQCLTAISNIHRTIEQSGEYSEPCQICIDLFRESLHNGKYCAGCSYHNGEKRYYRRGNPRTSTVVTTALRFCKKLCENHVKNKCGQILPSEMQKLRRHLCHSNSVDDYQLYVMSLVATYLFLRYDELVELKCEDFLYGCSRITSDSEGTEVFNMVFKVKGKMDKTHQLLVLWRCDEVPTLCPVRHLLFYLHLRGIKNGYIFPQFGSDQRFPYKNFGELIAKKFPPILGDERKLTTHFYRKTGYLFAVFGGGTFDIIRVAARHKSPEVAMQYFHDALTLKNMAEERGVINLENRVGTWRPSYLVSTENALSLNTSMYGYRSIPLYDLARLYSVKVCGIHSTTVVKKDLCTYINCMYAKEHPINVFQSMQHVISNYPQHEQVQIMQLLNEASNRQTRCIYCSRATNSNGTNTTINMGICGAVTLHANAASSSLMPSKVLDSPEEEGPSTSTMTDKIGEVSYLHGSHPNDPKISSVESMTANNVYDRIDVYRLPSPQDGGTSLTDCKETSADGQMDCPITDVFNPSSYELKKRPLDSNELSERKRLRNIKNPNERLDIILKLHDNYILSQSRKEKTTNSERSLYYNVLRPVNDCFANHFSRDKHVFLEKWGENIGKDYSRFVYNCCAGKSDACQVKKQM